MSLVLSLVAAKAKAELLPQDADTARRAVEATGANVGAADWLSPGEACDVRFEGDSAPALEAVRAAFSGRAVDVNVVAAEGRRKALFVADMDSTMIGQECVDELAAEVGLRDKVATITERAMRGEIDFAPALRERVTLLKGLPAAVIERVLSTRIAITPGARVTVATMRAAGAHAILVSGGFTAFVGPVARSIGFDETHANELLTKDGVFSGKVAEPILGAEAKVDTLKAVAARLGVAPKAALAIGDGANDAGMVKEAGLGVAFRAKPVLRGVADAAIDYADLSAVLFLQGYRREEFAAASDDPRV